MDQIQKEVKVLATTDILHEGQAEGWNKYKVGLNNGSTLIGKPVSLAD